MTRHAIAGWIGSVTGAVLMLAGCSSSNKPYVLMADLPSQDRIISATIEVNGANCTVHVVSYDLEDFWMPSCKVNKDQSNYKSFLIDGKQVDFGAVDNGFKVLTAPLPTLPPSDVPPATAAAGTPANAPAKPAAAPTPAPAASTTPPPPGEDFPSEWTVVPYPGQVQLQGQNVGFLVTSAKLQISGGDCALAVTFKASYSPFNFRCVAITNPHGDFHLLFNPRQTAKLTGGGNFDIMLTSEGTGISGNIWDSHGFDTWTPALPPQWVAAASDAN